MKKQAQDGISPRPATIESWQSTFMSWSLVDQANAIAELQLLHKWARKGRLGAMGQPAGKEPPNPAAPPVAVAEPARSQQEGLPLSPVTGITRFAEHVVFPDHCPHGKDKPQECIRCVAEVLPA
jgi:hypothetical protein